VAPDSPVDLRQEELKDVSIGPDYFHEKAEEIHSEMNAEISDAELIESSRRVKLPMDSTETMKLVSDLP